jgi:hypothetical protein
MIYITRTLLALCLLTLTTCQPLYAAMSLMPMPKAQFFTSQGAPLSGGRLYTCLPGTTCGPGTVTPKATYTDASGATTNANPVIMDSAGRANVWLTGFYKVALYDSAGNLIYTVDNVSAAGGSGGGGVAPLYYDTTGLSVTKDLKGYTEIAVFKTDSSANTVILIDTNGNTFPGGAASYVLTTGGEFVHLVLQGGIWYRE